MPNVNTNDRVRATAVLLGPSGEVQNVYYFRFQGVIPAGDLLVMADLADFLDGVYTDINLGIAGNYTYTEVRGFNMTQNVPMPTVSWPNLTTGGGSGGVSPSGVALLVILRTGISRVFGRKYFGGIIDGNIDSDGFWVSGLVSAGITAAGQLLTTFIGSTTLATYLPGIITSTNTFLGFISAVVTNNPSYQRRRRKGRGV